MFVRFRAVRHRLIVDLVETRRVGGKVKSEHIARLGSAALPEPFGPLDRVEFWAELKERFRDLHARLGNRVNADDRRKALAAIHARIPKPNEDDERAAEAQRQAARIRVARDDVAFWQREIASSGRMLALHREMLANCQKGIDDFTALSDNAERLTREGRARIEALMRGERVEGDDGPPARETMTAAAVAFWSDKAETRPPAGSPRAGPQEAKEPPRPSGGQG